MQTFSVYLRPEDPASGLPEYATCIEARTAWLAKSQAMAMLEEHAPESADRYDEPLVYEDHPGLPRPAKNVLSTDFLKTCCWDGVNQVFVEHEPAASKPVSYDALSADQKMAVLVRHGTPEIDSEQLKDAQLLLTDERDSLEGHFVESLLRTKGVAAMYPEVVLELIGELGNHFDAGDNWPQMKSFNEKWLKDRQTARKEKTAVTLTQPEPEKADADTGRPKRTYKHNYTTLDQEIAAALWPGDVTPGSVDSAILRWAKQEVIEKDREDWKRLSITLRIREDALKYDLLTIYSLVCNCPTDLYKDPAGLKSYVSDFLTQNGVFEDDEAQQDQAGKEHVLADAAQPAGAVEEDSGQQDGAAPGVAEQPPVTERTGPFYVRNEAGEVKRANKQKALEGLLAQGYVEISKDDYQQLKNAPSVGEKVEPTPATAPEEQLAANINNAEIVQHAPGVFSIDAFTASEASSEDENKEVTAHEESEPVAESREVYAGPGIYYQISNADYHAGPGVSKSQLDDIAVDPAIFQWRRAAPVDTDKTAALDKGTALHCLLLEPDEYDRRFIIAPEFNRRTREGKEEEKAFLESCEQSGKIIISHDDNRKLQLMRESVMAHPGARKLLEVDGRSEASVYWNDEETGELCRIRPDRFLMNTPFIVDVKKVADMSRFARHIEEFRYHVQAAMYCEGWRAHTGEVPRFVFLAVSESIECGRYPVRTFVLDSESMEEGFRLFRRDLETWHRCNESGEWGWGFEEIQRPYWARG